MLMERTARFIVLALVLLFPLCCSNEAPCPRRDAPGCPGSPGTEIHFPLTPGNKWVYLTSTGQRTYTRTDTITGFARFKGEEYAVLERRSAQSTDTKLIRQAGSLLFMFDANDTIGARGDSLRPTLPWTLVDFDEPQDGGLLYRVQYKAEGCSSPALEEAGVANQGREEYALGCCLLSKVQRVKTNRATESPCPAYFLTEETVLHIADEVGIVWEHYRWQIDEPENPLFGGTMDARLVSWEVH